jgi:hypothetical protein
LAEADTETAPAKPKPRATAPSAVRNPNRLPFIESIDASYCLKGPKRALSDYKVDIEHGKNGAIQRYVAGKLSRPISLSRRAETIA